MESSPTSAPVWVYLELRRIFLLILERVYIYVVERGEGREVVSVVIIYNPQDQHLGEYRCHAANSLGQDRQGFVLKGNV